MLSVLQEFYSVVASPILFFIDSFSCFGLCLFCLVMAPCGASAARASVSPGLNRLHLAVLGCEADLGWSSEVGCVLIISTSSLFWPFLSDWHKGDSEGKASTSRATERETPHHPQPPDHHIMPEDAYHCFCLFPHGSDLWACLVLLFRRMSHLFPSKPPVHLFSAWVLIVCVYIDYC